MLFHSQEHLKMQNFKQKLQQKLFPQQIHLMKLIELPTLAFEERISQEIEENPLLEIDKNNSFLENKFYGLNKKNNIKESVNKLHELNTEDLNINKRKISDNIFTKKKHNIYEYLRSQLCNFSLTDEEFIVTDFILGNIDDEGYLRIEYNELIHAIAIIIDQKIDKQKIEKLIEIIQKLEPDGVGARNLRECLFLQLNNKVISPTISIAKIIINNYFDLLCNKQYKKIKSLMRLNSYQLHSAIYEIKRLNPKPGKMYDDGNIFDPLKIVPDFLLRIEEGLLDVYINKHNTKKLYITPYYIEMLRKFQENYLQNKKNIGFIKNKLEKAKCFINAIKQRKKTLLFTMKAILNFQKEYFSSGEKQKIRPMTMKNIAEVLHMEISTVSRVVNKKYIETPFGTLLLKDLFSEKIFHTFGEEVSNIEVKYIISNLIDKEDRKLPFTDKKISLILMKKGYNVARRTITKYREQLNIPNARLRESIQ